MYPHLSRSAKDQHQSYGFNVLHRSAGPVRRQSRHTQVTTRFPLIVPTHKHDTKSEECKKKQPERGRRSRRRNSHLTASRRGARAAPRPPPLPPPTPQQPARAPRLRGAARRAALWCGARGSGCVVTHVCVSLCESCVRACDVTVLRVCGDCQLVLLTKRQTADWCVFGLFRFPGVQDRGHARLRRQTTTRSSASSQSHRQRHRKNSTSSRTVTHTRHPDTAHTRIHALGKAKSVKREPPTAETRISAHNHFTTLLTETRGSGLLRGPDER